MSRSKGVNEHLIGQPGSRLKLQTPCLVVDLDILSANIRTAGEICRSKQIALRPHGKTHKCSEIARLQIGAGANGICVATVGEAEAMAAAGVDDIHITSTFVHPAKVDRVVGLVKRGHRIRIVVDNIETIGLLAAACAAADVRIPVLIDIDMGRHRSGVTSPAAAVHLARAMSATGLELHGVQAYAGHLSHEPDFGRRLVGCTTAANLIRQTVLALQTDGHPVRVVSGGSTGSMLIDTTLGCYTELQCGSYPFMDVEYAAVDLDGHGHALFPVSLTVRTAIISRNIPHLATTDAGHKSFAGKVALPKPIGLSAVAEYRPVSDEHGQIKLAEGFANLPLGSAFECEVPHCDPTVNLFDVLHVVQGEELVAIWPIEARGVL